LERAFLGSPKKAMTYHLTFSAHVSKVIDGDTFVGNGDSLRKRLKRPNGGYGRRKTPSHPGNGSRRTKRLAGEELKSSSFQKGVWKLSGEKSGFQAGAGRILCSMLNSY
jgi:hypothetical protein